MCKKYGYVRVSSREQHIDRQLTALEAADIPTRNIYVDKISGKDFNRPSYRRLLKRLKQGDVLYVKSIDRLGRNYREIIEEWRRITKEKQADIVIIDMPLLDTRGGKNLIGTFISDLVLQILSFVAENERASIRRRQQEGIAAAQKRGVRFGRPCKPLPDNFWQQQELWQAGKTTLKEAAAACGMPVSTFYSKVKSVHK